ncbi:hypothetical protein [Streptomyces vinaceus]|uniref:hypothetical protein n=1 Tax=Streptomyces vinaceus TaxID=1960 RepID=UPI0036C083DD
MSYVWVGYAGYVDPSLPGHVVIPQGTALEHRVSDEEVSVGPGQPDIWDQTYVRARYEPGSVMPNLALIGMLDGDRLDTTQFDGYTLALPGTGSHDATVFLCTDTEGSCPVTPEQAAEGARHHCNGILRRHPDEEHVWMECRELTYVDATVQPAGVLQRSAEELLPQLLRPRTANAVQAELRRHIEQVLRCHIGDVLFAQGQVAYATRVMESVRARVGQVDLRRVVAAVVRNDLAECGFLSDDELAGCIQRELEKQTRQLLEADLGRLAERTRAHAECQGAPVSASDAEKALRETLRDRLDGNRDDLLADDLDELCAQLRTDAADSWRVAIDTAVRQLTDAVMFPMDKAVRPG